ncbi:MAG TPA: Fe-S-cluster-containing hydrogenase [Blastocatellia bacterium]|nr:Fe-S-cluster-containing hydrogenase [Blastocatellia bacterium]
MNQPHQLSGSTNGCEGETHKTKKTFWRTLEELAGSESQTNLVKRLEQHAVMIENALDRRDFIKLMSASLALAGITGCSVQQPTEHIVPYVRQPEEIVLGKPLFYATAMPMAGYAMGLLVESHEGRPTKIEGNPAHPASLGATDLFSQASVIGLYDPDRSQTTMYLGEIRSWGVFLEEFLKDISKQRASQGAGLRILTGSVTSPTLADQIKGILTAFPKAKWHQYEPAGRDTAREGTKQAFGDYVDPIYHFENADVVLSLDSDFLCAGPGSVRYSRDFMNKRRPDVSNPNMSRLYVAECTPTNTGAKADHRFPMRAAQVEGFARAVAYKLGINLPGSGATPYTDHSDAIAALARDLQAHRGSSVVIAGDYQPPIVHVIAHMMNESLGNIGKTVRFIDPVEANPTNQLESLRQLVNDMNAGTVELLVILGGNPVFTAPIDLDFPSALSKVQTRVHHSLYYDETSALCHWHVAAAHYLESWSDARAFDGTVSIIQPLIAPLYSGKTEHEMMAALSNNPDQTSYDLVRKYWQQRHGTGGSTGGSSQTSTTPGQASSPPSNTTGVAPALPNPPDGFDQWWRKSLRDGVVANTTAAERAVAIRNSQQAGTASNIPPLNPGEFEIVFRPDPSIFDGRFANNAWLQEIPKPFTKITWDNTALISPATAQRFAIEIDPARRGGEHGNMVSDVIELNYQGRTLHMPVWILPGHPDDSITVHFGYGRIRGGDTGSFKGFNTYLLRTSFAPWFDVGLKIRKLDETYELASTQAHHSMENRDLVRAATLGEFKQNPKFAKSEADDPSKSKWLFPNWSYPGYAWGMAIDINTCIGCNACVVACQAENNIPVVGKIEVMHGREMHWIRIDRYYSGDEHNPETHFQPVPCMHCEDAPCELVCPVEATTHSSEGINEMTYNRCVGTRYCSNNCPYKVRRFNFFRYADYDTPVVKLQKNPDVTVRSRGVMEKCTYCVQRINEAKITAEEQDRTVRDGEITPACAQACPTRAIVFGNINDPNSNVTKLKAEPRNYGMLADLNTRPRTTYLAEVRNPNPEIKTE